MRSDLFFLLVREGSSKGKIKCPWLSLAIAKKLGTNWSSRLDLSSPGLAMKSRGEEAGGAPQPALLYPPTAGAG